MSWQPHWVCLSRTDGGVIEILSSSQSGSESDLCIVGVDGAKDEGVRQLACRDIIVISSDSEPARQDKDGAPLQTVKDSMCVASYIHVVSFVVFTCGYYGVTMVTPMGSQCVFTICLH